MSSPAGPELLRPERGADLQHDGGLRAEVALQVLPIGAVNEREIQPARSEGCGRGRGDERRGRAEGPRLEQGAPEAEKIK
eukprot:6198516-Pyramimonas_sp.AAC.1